MERALGSLRMRLRDLAYQLRLPRFWRWWMRELAPLLPAAPRSALARRRARPVIEFGEGEAAIWRPELVDGALTLVRVASIALSGDASADVTGRAAIDAVAAAQGPGARGAPRLLIALAPKQVLRKEIVLPMAVEENLERTLAYDLDRHTPFRPDQVYFDAVVIDRDPAKKTLRVDWAAALKSVVDAAKRRAEDWGAAVIAVVPGPASTVPSRLNLLPAEARARRMLWLQWQVWVPTALVALVAAAVIVVPLLQKRGYAIALLQQTDAARAQAEAADGVRREFERLQGDYNYALARKYMYPGAVQIIDDITRVLPDDTWISQLEVKTTIKGKDMQRDVFLRGESANGSKLISVLEDSKLVEQAALRSPTTKLQPGPGEVFDLGAQLKVISAPAPEMVGAAPAAGAAGAAEAAAKPSSAAAPSGNAASASAPPTVPPATGAPGASTAATAPAPAAAPAPSAMAVPPVTAAPAATPAPASAPAGSAPSVPGSVNQPGQLRSGDRS